MTDSKVAVVTGAAKGIGRATAEALAGRGWNLVLLDIDDKGLRDVETTCSAAGAAVRAVACRVENDHEVEEVFRRVVAPLERCDLVVNCAGVGRYAEFMELTAQDWRDMMNINVLGTVYVIRAALPLMRRQGEGHIVMLGSQRGTQPTPATSAYSASKAALHGIVGSLGPDAGRYGVKVTLICPGGVKTTFQNIAIDKKDERFLETKDLASIIIGVVETSHRAWVRELTILPLGV